MRRRIRLGVCDFWHHHEVEQCPIIRLLRTRFDIVFSDKPDFLLYSVFGEEHYWHNCVRILYCGENMRPDWDECDYAFTFDHTDHPRHFRWPLYPQYGDLERLLKQDEDVEQILRSKTKFCNFIVSNHRCDLRNRFFDLLSQYKRVDSGGKYNNNLGYRVGNKLEFIRDYKFTIAFENSAHPGYTTEKIAEPMWSRSLPIYWGDPLVHQDFNPRSFINYDDYGSLEALVQRVIDVDQNDDLYLDYLRQPYFHGNQIPKSLHADTILDQFERIFDTPITPVAVTRPKPIPLQGRRRKWRAARTWLKLRVAQPMKRALASLGVA